MCDFIRALSTTYFCLCIYTLADAKCMRTCVFSILYNKFFFIFIRYICTGYFRSFPPDSEDFEFSDIFCFQLILCLFNILLWC